MSGRLSEREAKLELVVSVAHSQRALARMLDSVADLARLSPLEARAALENIRLLTNLQQSLTEAVVGVRLCERKKGKPGIPWLAEGPFMPNRQATHERGGKIIGTKGTDCGD